MFQLLGYAAMVVGALEISMGVRSVVAGRPAGRSGVPTPARRAA